MSIEIFSITATSTGPTIEEEQLWSCNATGGVIVANLGDASKCSRAKITLFKNDASANAVTVTPAGTQKILTTGGLAATFSLAAQGNSVTLVSDGTQWLLIAKI